MHKIYYVFIFICIFNIIISGPTFCSGNLNNLCYHPCHSDVDKNLTIGEELLRETLPLKGGSRLYKLQGLKSNTLYEVKISYPASIPASFYINLNRGKPDLGFGGYRRLLNTEKLIFKTDNVNPLMGLGEFSVLVTVEPEGFVAIPNVSEIQFILFNIVCDKLLLGIPHKAWWVVVLVALCLVLAFIIPSFLPSYLLPNHRSTELANSISKNS